MKRKLITVAIVILVIINLSALVTLVYSHWFKSKEDFLSPGSTNTFAIIQRELSLNDNQIVKMQALRILFKDDVNEVHVKLQDKRIALMDVLKTAAPDSARINQLVDEIGILQSELQRHAIRHILQEKAILTPKQREKFFTIFEDHICRRRMMPGHGHIRNNNPCRRSSDSEEK